ncbi:hypothetical protein ANN_26222 [Periplaneta americana]|uniref:HTH psq-type domain-containing protein n=1 Tax=Periplaneta americana TaxID=6978 RepID=A0ABQ8S5B6_PERAM|nr:hypothetical protein ANN_26222 [Periplaneta americana]
MPPIKGKMLNYSTEQMEKALNDVGMGMPVATAAKIHKVPRITLLYKYKGKSPKSIRMGSELILNEEEGLLSKWILSVAKAGFPITKVELLDSVQHLIKELYRPNPFVDGCPGRK